MAEVSKAEKIASARKKLKQFQLKNKDSYISNPRSTSSSLKSNSPVDAIFDTNETTLLRCDKVGEDLNLSTENVYSPPVKESVQYIKPQELFSLFSNENARNGNNSNFFDDSSLNVNENNQFFNVEERNSLDHVVDNSVKKKTINVENNFIPVSYNMNNDSSYTDQNNVIELEKLLSIERSSKNELQAKLIDSHGHILSLQHEIKRLNELQNQNVFIEIKELENQIRVNLQTIEILVSEKAELQKELMLLQDENKANKSKCEELASRLKASRCQVQKLEKELMECTEFKIHHNNILNKLEDDVKHKNDMIKDFSHKLTDAQNEIKELNRRFELESTNQSTLKKELKEMEKQLSMAQLKLTQLGCENGTELSKEFEKLKIELEAAKKEIENAWEEGRKCETELKQYISNLNSQVLQANAKCERAERDKEDTTKRVDSLVQHISELEKQLQFEKNSRETKDESEIVKNLKESLEELKQSSVIKNEEMKKLVEELNEAKERLNEAEIWKENMPDMGLLQKAMENDRVAAARAIEQNNALKQKLQELEEYIIKLNNSKFELTEELNKYQHLSGVYKLNLEKLKSKEETQMSDSVTQTIYVTKSDSVAQTSYYDLVPLISPHEPVTVETMVMIEGKLKKTMDKIAELSDEKQRLEHLVLQLQSETETIGEYVTLYQNQRSLLKEKTEEKERQMSQIAKEREELKAKLNEINKLLAHFPHNPDVEDTTCKISSLLGEIQFSSIVQENSGPPPNFHPCLLCSGKLINV